MLEPATRDQHAGIDQRSDHRLVGVALVALLGEDALAGEARRLLGEAPIGVDRVGDHRVDAARREPAGIRGPHLEVVAAVARSGMHEAGAGIVGDVIAGQERHLKIVVAAEARERMTAGEGRDQLRRHCRKLPERRHARLSQGIDGELFREDELVADLRPVFGRRVGDLIEPVADPGREADGAVARNGPRRRGPDDDRCLDEVVEQLLGGGRIAFDQGRERGLVAIDRKLRPHLIRDEILVLHLGLGERGLLHHRPHHRLRAAIERAVGRELHQLARDLRLGGVVHGRVGMRPVALDAEPLELLPLHLDPVLSEGAALATELDHRHRVLVLALGAILLLDLPLDRQAMAVPAGHVVRI